MTGVIMDNFEKILSQLFDMETLDPCDRLSKLIQETVDEDDIELDENELELVTAAGLPPYQEFMRRLGDSEQSVLNGGR